MDDMYNDVKLTAVALLTLMISTVSPLAAAERVRIGGTGSAIGTMQMMADAYQKVRPDVSVEVIPALGSGGGIKAVAAGVLNIGLSGRPLKPAERAQNLNQLEFARTPLVFASLKPYPGLTLAQVVQIYDGTISTWPDGSTVRLVIRPESDSETTLLRAISPEMNQALTVAHTRAGLHTAMTDPDMADALEKVPGSIGSSTLALILSENRLIKPIPLNGIVPSVSTIKNGTYPYTKPLYLVTSAALTPDARDFIQYMKSKAGIKLLLRNGYLVLD